MELPLYDPRKSERIQIALPLTYVIQCGTSPLEGRTSTIDVGGGGVRFVVPRMVSPQTMCRLTLTLPDRTEPLLFTARASWCRQISIGGHDQFELGAGFVISDAADDAAAFGHYCQFIAGRILLKHVG